jgi:hypothetical protein
VDSPLAALDSQETPDVVGRMKAVQVALAVFDFDMVVLTGVVGMPLAALLAVPVMEAVADIGTACDPIFWVCFESRL